MNISAQYIKSTDPVPGVQCEYTIILKYVRIQKDLCNCTFATWQTVAGIPVMYQMYRCQGGLPCTCRFSTFTVDVSHVPDRTLGLSHTEKMYGELNINFSTTVM